MSIITNYKHTLSRNCYNFFGWKTKRRIVVIESDDWGSERMPSKEVFSNLLNKGVRVDKCPFSKFDTIESENDLEDLFEVLSSQKDKNNNSAIITANFNMANPDFERIAESNYSKYFFHDYEATLEKYNRQNVLKLIHTGINENIFYPQNHSREHLSPYIWLEEIIKGNTSLKIGFENKVYGLSRATSPEIKKFHLASMLYENDFQREFVKEAITESVSMFTKYFHYKPKSFIAPVYVWNEEIENFLHQNDITFLQSSFYQNYFEPFKINELKRKFNYTGKTNKNNQIYTVRNCLFEPSIIKNKDCVLECLKEIQISFSLNRPAIISSHRLNYMGSLDKKNREKNLKSLKTLLSSIITKWPNVEFMNNVELAELIKNEKNN